jgi:hypothetical protein
VVLLAAYGQAAAVWAAPNVPLSKRHLQAVGQITDAYFRGDARSAVLILSPLLGKLNDARLEQFDHALSERGLPPVASILSDARLAMAQQGFEKDLPKLSARELILILPELQQQVIETLAAGTAGDPVADPPAQGALEYYETLLWSMHVEVNRLQAGKRLAEYTAQLARSVPRSGRARLDEQQREVLDRDYTQDAAKFDQAVAELAERELEIRLARLALAKQVLEDPGLTTDRFQAAYAWKRDSNQILLALENRTRQKGRPQPFTRDTLNAPDLAQRVAADADRCRELAGDLTQKATWLAEGLHWWLRGRYGAGPDVWGLAKAQAALKSPQAMFPLLMPAELPKPGLTTTMAKKGSSAQGAAMYCDRRHHRWWAWEDRRVQSSTFGHSQTSHDFKDWCKNGFFW